MSSSYIHRVFSISRLHKAMSITQCYLKNVTFLSLCVSYLDKIQNLMFAAILLRKRTLVYANIILDIVSIGLK